MKIHITIENREEYEEYCSYKTVCFYLDVY